MSPTAPPRPCTTPGCPELVAHGKCKAHRRQEDHRRPNATQRGYDASWRKLRAQVLMERPWCESPGCVEPATDVHHITKKAHGGPDTRENLACYCHRHHSAITLAENRGHESPDRTNVGPPEPKPDFIYNLP